MDLVALAAIAGGADAVAMAKAARAADWRALGWKAEKLVLHAAQKYQSEAFLSIVCAGSVTRGLVRDHPSMNMKIGTLVPGYVLSANLSL